MKIYNQILITLLLLPTLTFAQNPSSKLDSEGSFIRPYVEFGVNFLNNEALINRYNNTSLFHAGFGTYLGKPKDNFNLFAHYSVSSFTVISNGNSYLQSDSVLSLNQFSLGFINSVYRKGSNKIQLKLGFNQIWVDDRKNAVKATSYGFISGLRFEHSLGLIKVFSELSYIFSKAETGSFRDYDMKRLSFGIGF
jgi:hypothetical protein